jgi:hypothetical protein
MTLDKQPEPNWTVRAIQGRRTIEPFSPSIRMIRPMTIRMMLRFTRFPMHITSKLSPNPGEIVNN